MDYDEEERAKKQQYLASEILEQGYDGLEFKGFLDAKKENGGSNVDLWGYNELCNAVRQFKQKKKEETESHSKGFGFKKSDTNVGNFKSEHPIKKVPIIAVATPPASQTNIENNTEDKKVVFGGIKENEKDNEKFDFSQDEYAKIADCKLMPKSGIGEDEQLDIEIVDFEVKQGGMLSSSYALFKIVTKSHDWKVFRRFSEFFTLRNYLLKMFPSILIPPIPSKQVGRNLDIGYLNKRRSFLQKFLRDVANNPDLKCSKIFYDFLTLDENAIKSKLKDAENAKTPDSVDNYLSVSGKLNLAINIDIKNYIHRASDLVNSSEIQYQRLAKLNKQLLLDFEQISATLFNMSDTFIGLYTINNTFNSSTTKAKNGILDDMYLTFNNLMVDWGNLMLNQVKIVQDNLKNFFKYEKNFNDCLKDIIKDRNNVCIDYYKAREKEQKRQIDLQTGNKNKLTSIFNKDDAKCEKNLIILRDKFAYTNQKVYDELDRGIKEKGNKYLQNFDKFMSNQNDLFLENQNIWALYKKEVEKLLEGQKSDLSIKKIDKKKIILTMKGDNALDKQ